MWGVVGPLLCEHKSLLPWFPVVIPDTLVVRLLLLLARVPVTRVRNRFPLLPKRVPLLPSPGKFRTLVFVSRGEQMGQRCKWHESIDGT